MSDIKRNDPCYCGSGKKYKSCHLSVDREKEQERREWQVAARFLRQDLLKYAKDERFSEPFATAISHYWNGLYDAENAEEMSQPEAFRFFDWFTFDATIPTEDGGKTRLVEQYKQENWDELSSYQQETLENWLGAMPASAFKFLSYKGNELTLRRLLTDEKYVVYEGSGHGEAEPGDIMLARLVKVLDRYEFSTNAAYLPQAEIADLLEKLENARSADPDSDFDDFVRQNSVLPIHHALAQAEEHGRPPVARLDPDRSDGKVVKAARGLRRVAGRKARKQKSTRDNKMHRIPTLHQRKSD